MAHVIDDEIYCCTDCLMIITNDDASGMNDETEAICRLGIATFDGYLVCNDGHLVYKIGEYGDVGPFGFRWSLCEVCGSSLGGDRHRLALLSK